MLRQQMKCRHSEEKFNVEVFVWTVARQGKVFRVQHEWHASIIYLITLFI